jgi:hypothetical protein
MDEAGFYEAHSELQRGTKIKFVWSTPPELAGREVLFANPGDHVIFEGVENGQLFFRKDNGELDNCPLSSIKTIEVIRPEEEKGTLEVHDQLVAKEFVLVDEQKGDIAATITASSTGFVGFRVGSPKPGADPTAYVGIEPNTGAPVISVSHRGGSVTIAIGEDGRPGILLTDAEGNERSFGPT